MDTASHPDVQEIRALASAAWALRKQNRHKALQMAMQAQGMLAQHPHARAIDEFDALKTLAYCLDRLGKPEEALKAGLKARHLVEQTDDNVEICTVQGLLGRTYWHIDDFPTALDCFLGALKSLPPGSQPDLEISLINGLGLVQFGLGNYTEALEHFTTCLNKAGENDGHNFADANNNIAYVLHVTGRSREALEYGQAALAKQKQLESVGGIMETLHSVGAIHLALGHHDKAMIVLNEGLDLARRQQSQLLELTFLHELGRLYQVIGDLAQAHDTGLEALEMAEQIGSVSNVSNIHKFLSEVCEARGDKEAALAHFKAYHAAYVRIFNGKIDQRIRALEIFRELEASRQQADLYRELAGTDLLTRLFNRRGLMEHLSLAIARSKRQDAFGAVLFVDVDDFKQLNDSHGHGAGDALLIAIADRLRAIVRESDAVARFGGDEFVVVLEGLGSDAQNAAELADKMAAKIRQSLRDEEYTLGTLRYRASASVGSTQFRGDEASVDHILKVADTAMYADKQASGR